MWHLNAEVTDILLKHLRVFCKPVMTFSGVSPENRKALF